MHANHTAILTFLKGSANVGLDSDVASELVEQASTCNECASALAESREHAVALIEARQAVLATAHAPPADEEDLVKADLEEIVTFAKRVTSKLSPEIQRDLGRALGRDERQEPFDHLGLDPLMLRVSLAVSEASLVLLSLLSEHSNVSVVDNTREIGSVKCEGRLIPATYVASRISSQAGLPLAASLAIWTTLVSVAKAGKIGFPGVHAKRGGGSRTSSYPPSADGIRIFSASMLN
jgi:hypothetical protein